jgi:hypothetical protein
MLGVLMSKIYWFFRWLSAFTANVSKLDPAADLSLQDAVRLSYNKKRNDCEALHPVDDART